MGGEVRLPDWAIWVQTIGTPALAIVLAGFGSYIAYQQSKTASRQEQIARERLKHDLYDRRYAIFLAFNDMIIACLQRRDDIDNALGKAIVAKAQSRFILTSEIGEYLEKLHTLAFTYHQTRGLTDPAEMSQKERFDLAADRMSDAKSLMTAHRELSKRFEPFLKLDDMSA